MHPPENEPYIDRGEPLPQSYPENSIVAMVRDPYHLYTYWDVEPGSVGEDEALFVRVRCLSEKRSHDIVPPAFTDNWYLKVAPNRTYQAELFKRGWNGLLVSLALSGEVSTPVAHAGESGVEVTAEMVTAEHRPLSRKAASSESVPSLQGVVPRVMPSTSPPVAVVPPLETVISPDYASGRGG